MGVPPVIIHFRLGFSMTNQRFIYGHSHLGFLRILAHNEPPGTPTSRAAQPRPPRLPKTQTTTAKTATFGPGLTPHQPAPVIRQASKMLVGQNHT